MIATTTTVKAVTFAPGFAPSGLAKAKYFITYGRSISTRDGASVSERRRLPTSRGRRQFTLKKPIPPGTPGKSPFGSKPRNLPPEASSASMR